MEQEALVRAARDGDGEALGELVRCFHGPLTAYLIRLGGDRELALDLAQETFCRVCLHLASLEEPEAFRVWLYRTARNLFLDHRRSWYWRRVSIRPESDGREQPGPGPEEAAIRRDEGEWVRRALETLSPAHREVIILRYYEDMTLGAIAKVTGLPLGTVKSRLHHAQRALAGRLRRETPAVVLKGRWQGL
ncbi:MAG: sigma-70 family RNA polymerase sigma factor [bacterium]|nr:sigma-70 family RNA polymerase sigma factor [bacterium]